MPLDALQSRCCYRTQPSTRILHMDDISLAQVSLPDSLGKHFVFLWPDCGSVRCVAPVNVEICTRLSSFIPRDHIAYWDVPAIVSLLLYIC